MFYLFLLLWYHGYIHMYKLIQMYTLNIRNFLYIKCILVKLGRSFLTQSYEAWNSADIKFSYISQLYVWFLFTFQWTILQPKGKKNVLQYLIDKVFIITYHNGKDNSTLHILLFSEYRMRASLSLLIFHVNLKINLTIFM